MNKESNRVSGTGHTKKKRDWKAINANRRTAKFAAAVGLSRWSMEEMRWLYRLTGDEFRSQIESDKLTVAQAKKILQDRMLAQLAKTDQEDILEAVAWREVQKHWRCMAKALRAAGYPEDQLLSKATLMIRYIIEDDVSGTGHIEEEIGQ